MSDRTQKQARAGKSSKIPIAFPPQVNLLPPEVGQRKAAARARGRAIFVAIVAVTVVVLASAGMNLYALQRFIALENARTLTQSLIAQQGEYNEVRVADQLVRSTTSARIFATSTEISLNTIIVEVGKKLPEKALVVSHSFETATPLQGYGESTSVLDPTRMAQLLMEVSFSSVSEVDKWIRAVRSVEGITDSTLVAVDKEPEGTFTAEVILFIGDDALVHRFDGVEEPANGSTDETETGTESEAEPSEEPSPEPDPESTEDATEEGSD